MRCYNVRIPLNVFRRGLYNLLSSRQNTVKIRTVTPNNIIIAKGVLLCSLDEMTVNNQSTKDAPMWYIEQVIKIFSDADSVEEILDIAEDLSQIYSVWDLSFDNGEYVCVDKKTVNFELSNDEIFGFTGVLTLGAKIQQVKN